MRKPIIAGNWKMNKTPGEAAELVKTMLPLLTNQAVEIVICPPSICIPAVAKVLKGSRVRIGAQNVHYESKGAYTGEISADMLKELGVRYVIVGHSERRQYFGETDETVNLRAKAALAAGINPIICVGELLSDREKGITFPIVERQVRVALMGIDPVDVPKAVIAYEPVWAIGTGKTATPEDAEEVIAFIRGIIKSMFSRAVANAVRIQYGGSMNPHNVTDLMAMPNIDGGLIGGASLKAADFSSVVNY